MLKLREFLGPSDADSDTWSDLAAGDVVTTKLLGLDVAAVLLPSEALLEDRVSRMNEFWDLIAGRDVLVVALSRGARRQ